MANKIGSKLLIDLPKTIAERLQYKLSADVEAITCTDEDQGPFLFSTINELNMSAKKHAKETSEGDPDHVD